MRQHRAKYANMVRGGDCGRNETIWVHAGWSRSNGDRWSESVRIDPAEPQCSSVHDWQSPIEIVGGIKENPGCWGHGGGVIIEEVCLHCGCGRTTDTWAQNPETGEQGLHSLKYELGKYSEQVEALR